eukprot:1152621-Pelagomonas_calceolata.AAC.3
MPLPPQAIEYRQRILACVPPSRAPFFQPLMTCYLTDRTTPEEVEAAKEAGVIAFKLYPAGENLMKHRLSFNGLYL